MNLGISHRRKRVVDGGCLGRHGEEGGNTQCYPGRNCLKVNFSDIVDQGVVKVSLAITARNEEKLY